MTLQDQLDEARRLSGQARYAALDSVLRHADAAGEQEFAYRTRMQLVTEFRHDGEYARAFLAFASCLSTFDRRPDLVRGGDEHHLLWTYKGMASAMSRFATVPLERAHGLLDDMERRFRAGGHSLHAVYERRAVVAIHLGDLDAAGRWYAEMATARRDGLSNCSACAPGSVVIYHTERGDDEAAVLAGHPHLRGGCGNQPQTILTHLMLPYLRTGRRAEAVGAHRQAYPRHRDERDDLGLIARHLQFCALTGNQERGLALAERHLPWLDRPCSQYDAMRFAASAALLMRRLCETGHGGDPVRRRTDRGDRRWTATVAQTYEELAALARSLGAAFDARNGNAYQGGQVELLLAAEPAGAALPLTVLQGRPLAAYPGQAEVGALVARVAELTVAGDAAAAARTRLQIAFALRAAAQWTDATETAEEALRSLQQAGLTGEAMHARYLLALLYGREWSGRAPAYTVIAELLAAPSLPEDLPSRARLLEQAARFAREPAATEHRRDALDRYRAAGDAAGQVRVLRAGYSRAADRPAVLAQLDALGGALTGSALFALQEFLCDQGTDPAARLARARRYPGDHAGLRLSEAEALLTLQRPAEAQACARPYVADERLGWLARQVVAKSLLAEDRTAEAQAFLAEHGLDLGDLDDMEEFDDPDDSDDPDDDPEP